MSSHHAKHSNFPDKFSVIHNEDALNCLILATSRSEMFQRIWNKNDRVSFMRLFRQERYNKGDILVEYGAPLMKFYVIDEGAFEVLEPKDECDATDAPMIDSSWRLVTMLYENENFGEPALENAVLTHGEKLLKSPFRVKCAFPSRVWSVTGDAFARRWDALQDAISKEIHEGISKFEILQEWMHQNPEKVMEMLGKCRVMDLGPENCVIRQSVVGRNAYVLMKGHATRFVDDRTNVPLTKVTGTYSPDDAVFGTEALRGEPYVETVVIKSRKAKLIVIPARI